MTDDPAHKTTLADLIADAIDGATVGGCPAVNAVAADVIAQLRATGWVIVPREPTEAMVLAGPGRPSQASEESMYHGIWRAMVAAAEAGK